MDSFSTTPFNTFFNSAGSQYEGFNALNDEIVEERKKYLSEAKAVISPSFYAEPFGLTPIEAGLSGTPVIASYSGFKSMINEANCGVFIDAEDPVMLSHTILEYYDKPVEELAQIGRRGREWLLEHADWAGGYLYR